MILKKCHTLATLLLAAASSTSAEAAASDVTPDSVASEQLQELTVIGNSAHQRVAEKRISAEHLELAKLTAMPSLGGEHDVIKALALLPGVRSEGDGGGGFEVRGGNASQNLVLLDGMALYNPAHVMGIFSTFNDNAFGAATLFKGPFPASFGNASSAVLETTLAPGDMTAWHGSGTIGILAAKIRAEGPIVKDKLSLAVDARRSYVDVFLKIIPQYRTTIMNFHDISAKLRYRPDASNTIDGSFFYSRDHMAVSDLMSLIWGNLAGSINWRSTPSDRLSLTTTASLTHYDPCMGMDLMDVDQTMWTYIHNYALNERIQLNLNDYHALEFGLRSEFFRVKSAEWKVNATRQREVRQLWTNALWAEYSGSFADRLDLVGGLRLNMADSRYFSVEPRISLKYSFSPLHSVKVGYGMSSQYLHTLRSTTTTFPFDRTALTSAEIEPERSTQYGLGYNGMTSSGAFDWSAEVFYRHLSGVYDFLDGRGPFSDVDLQSLILGGKGRSYGLELMARKNAGRLTGWVSYTLSRTQTKIPGINDGSWYAASNDRRHDVTITAIYRLSDRWQLTGSWIFLSGQPLTVPDVKYEIAGETCYYYSRRNAYRAPSTHRLDLSATYRHVGPKFTYEWAFGIYNAYCRYNPYVVYFEDDPTKPSGTRAVKQAMYGLIPSVSYTLKF